jgi:hypothetical protein
MNLRLTRWQRMRTRAFLVNTWRRCFFLVSGHCLPQTHLVLRSGDTKPAAMAATFPPSSNSCWTRRHSW